jgi:hypothetical protein
MSKFTGWLYVVLVLILPIVSHGQEWVARYNGPDNNWDGATGIAVDDMGNVIVTGSSDGGSTGRDYATIKYNTAGVEQWVVRYNGPGNGEDGATAIAVDNAGNVYVTGYSYDPGTGCDYATVKYDAAGTEQWVLRYNGPGNSGDTACAIAVDNAGNICVTGYSCGSGTGMDYATVKYDAAGVEQWVARYNGPHNLNDEAWAIAVDNAANIHVTGGSEGAGTDYDYATVKYNPSGVELWVARYANYGYSWNSMDCAEGIAVDNTGNVYVTGTVHNGVRQWDYATIKYDTSGVEQWVTWYNGPYPSSGDFAGAIAINNAGDVYVTGTSWGMQTERDYATVKYNPHGVEQWVVRYNGSYNGIDVANAIGIDNGGNIHVTGFSYGIGFNCDYATVKYDGMGVEQWVRTYNGPGDDWDQAVRMVVDDAGNVYVTGASEGSGTGVDYATIKYSPTCVEEGKSTPIVQNQITATIIHGSLPLPEGEKCKIFDITGRIVEPDRIQPGIYFIEIDGEVVQKVVKIR